MEPSITPSSISESNISTILLTVSKLTCGFQVASSKVLPRYLLTGAAQGKLIISLPPRRVIYLRGMRLRTVFLRTPMKRLFSPVPAR